MRLRSFRTISLATLVVLAAIGVAVGQTGMDELVAAAKKEGQLTTIALPHDWCGYGEVIESFKAKYGLEVNELNPDAGSGDEIEAIKANKGNTGPQAPDVIDVGLSFGPSAKAEGLLQPYKVATWDTIPDSAKDADGYWYGDYYGVLAFEVNTDIVKNVPQDWADLLKADYKNAVALAGDPRASNQAIQGVYAAGLAAGGAPAPGGRGGPEVLRRPQQGRQLRAGDRQGGLAGAGLDADHHPLGLQRARRPRHARRQPAGRGRGAEDRRRRRRLRAGDQRLRPASERGEAVDGVPLFRRGPARSGSRATATRSASTTWRRTARSRRSSWTSCRRRRPTRRRCSRPSTSRAAARRSSPSSGTPSSAPTSSSASSVTEVRIERAWLSRPAPADRAVTACSRSRARARRDHPHEHRRHAP